MKWLYRGRHRRNRFSAFTVDELIWECNRISIADIFAVQRRLWEGR